MEISPGGSEGARIGSSPGPSNTAPATVVHSYISIRLQWGWLVKKAEQHGF